MQQGRSLANFEASRQEFVEGAPLGWPIWHALIWQGMTSRLFRFQVRVLGVSFGSTRILSEVL